MIERARNAFQPHVFQGLQTHPASVDKDGERSPVVTLPAAAVAASSRFSVAMTGSQPNMPPPPFLTSLRPGPVWQDYTSASTEELGDIWSHPPARQLQQLEAPSVTAAFSAANASGSTATTAPIYQPAHEEVLYHTESSVGDEVPFHTELHTSWQNFLQVHQ
jgi:hypothetical protein